MAYKARIEREEDRITFYEERGNLITSIPRNPTEQDFRKAYGAIQMAREADAITKGKYLQYVSILKRKGMPASIINAEEIEEISLLEKKSLIE